jgi:hypothetical protein
MAGLKKDSNLLDQGKLAASKASRWITERAGNVRRSTQYCLTATTAGAGSVKRKNHNYCLTFKEKQNRRVKVQYINCQLHEINLNLTFH